MIYQALLCILLTIVWKFVNNPYQNKISKKRSEECFKKEEWHSHNFKNLGKVPVDDFLLVAYHIAVLLRISNLSNYPIKPENHHFFSNIGKSWKEDVKIFSSRDWFGQYFITVLKWLVFFIALDLHIAWGNNARFLVKYYFHYSVSSSLYHLVTKNTM